MELLALFDTRGMNKFRRDFSQKPGGITLTEFISIFLRRLPETGLSDIELVQKLKDLFHQVDVNDDGVMEWEEFSSFCIEMGMASTAAKHLDVCEKYVPRAYDDTTSHTPCIAAVKFIPVLEKVFVCETLGKEVKVYNPHYNSKNGKEIMKLLHTMCPFEVEGTATDRNDALSVLNIEFMELDGRNFLVTAETDLKLTFWDTSTYDISDTNPPRFLTRVSTPTPQLNLCWAGNSRNLFTTGADTFFTCWKVSTVPEFSVVEMNRIQKHTDILQSLVYISEEEMLVTAALDCKIYLWENNGTKWKWKGERSGHRKGVRSLAYAEEGILLSAGFDLIVLVWDIIGLSQKPLMCLQGHVFPLLAVSVLPSKQHAVTIDIKGIIKTWDIRREGGISDSDRGVQTFQKEFLVPGAVFEPSSITVSQKGSIIVSTSKLHIWDSVKIRPQNYPPIDCIYNPVSMTIISAMGKDVKVWCARTGKLISHFQSLTPAEITSLQLDFRKRKFILSDQLGSILVFNYMNGSKMKENSIQLRKAEISGLAYVDEDRLVVSAGWDKCIRVYDETQRGRMPVLRTLNYAHKSDINALAISHSLSLIASGAEDGTCRIWDYQFLNCEGDLKVNDAAAITSLTFVEPFPLLISGDEAGFVRFWTVRPWGNQKYHRYHQSYSEPKVKRNECIAWLHNGYNAAITKLSVLVNEENLSTCQKRNTGSDLNHEYFLYITDDSGYVTCYDITSSLTSIGMLVPPDDMLPKSQGNYNAMRKCTRNHNTAVPKAKQRERISTNPKQHPCNNDVIWTKREIRLQHRGRWKAHSNSIESIECMSHPETFLTCSTDQSIKLFSGQGIQLGILNTREDKFQVTRDDRLWHFPVDLEKREHAEKRIAKMLVADLIEKEKSDLIIEGYDFKEDLKNKAKKKDDKGEAIQREIDIQPDEKEAGVVETTIRGNEILNDKHIEDVSESNNRTKNDTTIDADQQGSSRSVHATSIANTVNLSNHEEKGGDKEDESILGEDNGGQLRSLLQKGEDFRTRKRKEAKAALAARKAERKVRAKNFRQIHNAENDDNLEATEESVLDLVVKAQRGCVNELSDRERAVGQLMGKVTWIKTQQELAQDAILERKKKMAKAKLSQHHEIGLVAPKKQMKRKKKLKKKPEKMSIDAETQQFCPPKEEKIRVIAQEHKNFFEENNRAKMKEKQRKGDPDSIMNVEMSPLIKELVEKERNKKTVGFVNCKTMSTNKPTMVSKPPTESSGLFCAVKDIGWKDVRLKIRHELEQGLNETKEGAPKTNTAQQESQYFDPVYSISDNVCRKNITSASSRESQIVTPTSDSDDRGEIDFKKLKATTVALEKLELVKKKIEKRTEELVRKNKHSEKQSRNLRIAKRRENLAIRICQANQGLTKVILPTNQQLERVKNSKYFGPYSKTELYYVRHVFQTLDQNKDGLINLDEYRNHIDSTGPKHGKFRALIDRSAEIFNCFEKDGSGALSIEEMVRLLFKKANRQEMLDILLFINNDQQELKGTFEGLSQTVVCRKQKSTRNVRMEIYRLFDIYDTDGDGYISKDELQEVLEYNTHGFTPPIDFEESFPGRICTKGIDFEEFYQLFHRVWI